MAEQNYPEEFDTVWKDLSDEDITTEMEKARSLNAGDIYILGENEVVITNQILAGLS